MKPTTTALLTLALTSASTAQEGQRPQDISAIVSSALSVASSYVANHDMNTIVSSGLSIASSWAAENDIDAIISSVGAEVGITDSSGVESAFSRATEVWASLTDGLASGELPDITGGLSSVLASATAMVTAMETGSEGTAAQAAGTGESVPAATSTGGAEDAAPVSSMSYDGGAAGADWGASGAAVVGSFFLGLVAYL